MVATPPAHTEFAARAITIAEAFGLLVGAHVVKGPVQYRAEMVAPDGLSTGGGRRSMQHLRLVPVGGGMTVVIGSCDQIEMSAVLRSWELLAEQYAQRFKGARLPLDAVEYGRLLERMEDFFRERTMRVDKLDVDRRPSGAPARPKAAAPAKTSVPSVPWIVALVALGAAIGSALTVVLR